MYPIFQMKKMLIRQLNLLMKQRTFATHNPFKRESRAFEMDETAIFSSYELLNLLKSSVLYESANILACYKPYGVSTMGPNEVIAGVKDDFERHMRKLSTEKVCIHSVLPELASQLGCKEFLIAKTVPRYVSGIVILAKSDKIRRRVQSSIGYFQSKRIPYIHSRVVTIGTPDPTNGVNVYSSMKIAVGDKKQFVLTSSPTLSQISHGVVVRGVVEHSTLDTEGDCSLVDLHCTTLKFDIPRLALVHLGAPIIGDVYQQRISKIMGKSALVEPSKASVKNQYVPLGLLQKLEISINEYYNLPLCFHVYGVRLRNVDSSNEELMISCPTPPHFQRFCATLELKEPKDDQTDS